MYQTCNQIIMNKHFKRVFETYEGLTNDISKQPNYYWCTIEYVKADSNSQFFIKHEFWKNNYPKDSDETYSEVLQKEFKTAYENSNKDEIEFLFCPLSTYKKNYSKKLEKFLTESIDSSELEFLEAELNKYPLNLLKTSSIILPNFAPWIDIIRLLDPSTKRNIQNSIKRTHELLKYKITRLKQQTTTNTESLSDLSDNIDVDKVRTLILLGIVNDLYEKKYPHSVSALATDLSGVTGIKASTLKSYLNAYLKNPNDKNNPMIYKSKVLEVSKRLTRTIDLNTFK